MRKAIYVLFVLLYFAGTAMAVESICPGGSSPSSNVLWCDDFDDGSMLSSPSWSTESYCDSYPSGNYVQCSGAGYPGYNTSCAAWSDPIGFCGIGWTHSCAAASASNIVSLNEIYVRAYMYFSSDYVWGEGDKGIYVLGSGINAKIEWSRWGGQRFSFSSYAQEPNEIYQNQGNDLVMTGGNWYYIEIHIIPNTDGQSNGTVEIWANLANSGVSSPTLRLRSTSARMRYGGTGNGPITGIYFEFQQASSGHSGSYECTPGMVAIDQIVVSRAPIGPIGSISPPPPNEDTMPPYTSSWSPARNSTGVDTTNRTVIARFLDAGDGVDIDTISMTINGTEYVCADPELACTGTAANYLVTYTKGSDWTCGVTDNVILNATDLAGNAMTAQSYNFAIKACAPPNTPLIFLTQGLPNGYVNNAYSHTLSAQGGVPPYTYAITSGSLPAGLSLSGGTYVNDNFNRANQNPLAGNWTTLTGGIFNPLKIASNAVYESTIGNFGLSFYSGQSWNANQSSRVKVGELNGSGPAVRVSSASGGNGIYLAVYSNTVEFWQTVAGVEAHLTACDNDVTQAIVAADIIELSASGNIYTYKKNGVSQWSCQNSSLSSGSPGITVYSNTATPGYIDDWYGANLSSPGVISGTPTLATTRALTITVTDSASNTANKAFSITILPGSTDNLVVPNAPTGSSIEAGNQQIVFHPGTSANTLYYNAYYNTGDTNPTKTNYQTKISNVVNNHTIGATNGTTYRAIFTAVGTGGESVASAVSVATTANPVEVPSAPTGLSVTSLNGSVRIYPGYSSGASSYNCYYTSDGTNPNTGDTEVTGATNGQVISGLTNNTQYKFACTAVNAAGESALGAVASAIPFFGSGVNYLSNTGNFVISSDCGGVNYLQ